MNAPSLVVFDMAGTTVEDRGQVPSAFAAALAAHGITVTADQINRVRGASKREAILQLVPPGPHQAEDAAVIYASFRGELAGRYVTDGVRPIAGAEAAMRALRARGIRVALTTGFDRDTTALLLTKLGWLEGTADTIVCGDDVAHGRPAPDLIQRAMQNLGVTLPETVANVGDTTLDLEAGSAAGVGWNIGVLSGAHARDAMQRAPHTHLIESVADLTGLWEET
jgi:phosphonatase-like hydrolase